MSSPRRILLIDADAFFVAVARIVDPEGAGRAKYLIVGGRPGSRGVVCSASYETRRFGVRSAMPISRALRLCPDATCVPVPRKACSAKHREIRAVLERIAPVVQAASIDEWYCDLGGTDALYAGESLADTARRLRADVMRETGMSVSVGGGTSRLVAKLAVERAKPKPETGGTGVHVVPAGEEQAFLSTFALADLPLVGPRFQERLARLGMRTVPDVLQYDLPALTRWLGAREAQWLYDRVRGIDHSEVESREDARSISRDETFDRDIADDPSLETELLRLVVRAASDLRGDGLQARTVTVRLRDNDFRTRQAGRTVPRALVSDRAILAVARELLARLRSARRMPARLIGVSLSGFTSDPDAAQMALFESGDESSLESERDRVVARTVDRLRQRFGPDAVLPGGLVTAAKPPSRTTDRRTVE